MNTIQVQIDVPQGMANMVTNTDKEHIFARNAMMLYPYIQDLTISHGRAAELLGINKLDLIEFYNKIGIPYLNQSVTDLEEELEEYRAFRGEGI